MTKSRKRIVLAAALLLIIAAIITYAIIKANTPYVIQSEAYYHEKICAAHPEFDASLYEPIQILPEYSQDSYVCLMYVKTEQSPIDFTRFDGDEPNSIQLFLYAKADGQVLMLP